MPGYVTKIDDEHYIIVNDWIPPEPPQTGDFDTFAIMALMTVVVIGMVVVKKKKRVDAM